MPVYTRIRTDRVAQYLSFYWFFFFFFQLKTMTELCKHTPADDKSQRAACAHLSAYDHQTIERWQWLVIKTRRTRAAATYHVIAGGGAGGHH
jgi:hypothetical protein